MKFQQTSELWNHAGFPTYLMISRFSLVNCRTRRYVLLWNNCFSSTLISGSFFHLNLGWWNIIPLQVDDTLFRVLKKKRIWSPRQFFWSHIFPSAGPRGNYWGDWWFKSHLSAWNQQNKLSKFPSCFVSPVSILISLDNYSSRRPTGHHTASVLRQPIVNGSQRPI